MVRNCLKCGKEIQDETAAYCPHCASPVKPQLSKISGFPIAGGVLLIIAASICLIVGIFAIGVFVSTYQYAYYYGWGSSYYYRPRYEDLLVGIFGTLAFALGLTAGITSLKRNAFAVSILGACFAVSQGFATVLAFVTQWPNSWIVGIIFGMPILVLATLGLIFTAISKAEFRQFTT